MSGLRTLAPVGYASGNDVQKRVKFDIVFVHGLNGDLITTWKATNGCFWPQDCLAPAFPTARIMTFGYNANVLKNSVNGRIAEFASNLLSEIRAERMEKQEQHRPLFFICHSLGGIVVKRTLVTARGEYNDAIADSTKGIIFLATPHRGSPTATLGEILNKLLNFVTPRPLGPKKGPEVIKELKEFSNVLTDLHKDFVGLPHKHRIVSFFEKAETFNMGLIVKEYSATMDTEKEIGRIAVAADHRAICRFSSAESDEFKTLLKQLKSLIIYGFPPNSAPFEVDLSAPSHQPVVTLTEQHLTIRPPGMKRSRPQSVMEAMGEHKRATTHIPRASQARCWNIPHFTKHLYFDREREMKLLEDSLFGTTDERSFGIYGIGGVGKTQLALKAIDAFSDRYSHVFWIPAETELKLADTFRQIAISLDLIDVADMDSEKDPIKILHVVKDWLQQNSEWLLVFDNADNTNEKTLRRYFPSPVRGSIITTSRGPGLIDQRVVSSGVQLKPLDNSQGTQFLLGRLENSNYRSQEESVERRQRLASEISDEMGGHCLGLATMAAYIQQSSMGLQEFLNRFRRNRSKLISGTKRLHCESFDYELSLATCWSISMESLNGDDPGDLLGIISMLDPDRISEDILKGFAEDSEENGYSEDATVSVLRDAFAYLEATVALRSQGLIQSESRESRQFITIHRLVQEAAIRHGEESGQLGNSFDGAVKCLRRIYPRQNNGESMVKNFTECSRLTPHIANLEAIFTAHFLIKKNSPQHLPKGRGSFIGLLADAGWYLYETGLPENAKALLATAEKICDGLIGDKPDLLKALVYNNLGVIYDSENKWDTAFQYASKCAEIREQLLDPNDPEMGNSWNNLGNCMLEMGDIRLAKMYFEKTALVHESSKQPSDDLLEGAYSSLALCHIYLDTLDEAERYLQKAFSYHERLPPNHFTAITISELGMLRMRQGRWTAAKQVFLRCLAAREKIYEDGHRLIGTCLHHIAFVDARLRNYHDAISRLRKAVEIFSNPAETRPCLLERSLLKLADCLERTGDDRDAREAMEIRAKVKRLCKGSTTERLGEDETAWNQQVCIEYRCLCP